MNRMVVFAWFGMVAGAIPASAHHSFAPYAMNTVRTIDGTVAAYYWTNPHARLDVTVIDRNGRPVEWHFEGNSITALSKVGWKKDSLTAGDKITVAYAPLRSGAQGGYFVAVIAPGGKLLPTDRYKPNVFDKRGPGSP